RESVFRLVPGDETRVDGADRSADDPVGLDACLMQRLIDAALISAERPSALQDENNLTIIVVADLVDGFKWRQFFLVGHSCSSRWDFLRHLNILFGFRCNSCVF